MRELHTFSADEMLAQLEERQEAYVAAKHQSDFAERQLKSMYAARYTAIKASGCSVEDAKQQALNDSAYIEAADHALEQVLSMERAKNALERVRTAIELWRTEQASLRRV